MEELPEQVLKDIEAIRERVTDLNKDGRAMKVVENSLQELEKIVMVENEIYQIKKQLQTLPANSVVRKSMEEALAKLESDSMSSQSNSRGPSSSSIKNPPAPAAGPAAAAPPPPRAAAAPAPAAPAPRAAAASSSSPAARVVARVTVAVGAGRTVPRAGGAAGAHSALALAAHCLLLDAGLVCTGVDAAAADVPGFAAPVRDVPARFLVPRDWDSDPNCISLQYRHEDPALKGKKFLFKSVAVGPRAMLHLAERGREGEGAARAPADPEQAVDAAALALPGPPRPDRWYRDLRPLQQTVQSMLLEVLPPVPAAAGPMDTEEPAPPQQQAPRRAPPAQPLVPAPHGGGAPPAAGRRDPLRDYSQPSSSGGAFGGDLDPLSGGMGPGGPGPGGLMGPGHPLFAGPGGGGGLGGPGGRGGMRPRFDPYGPEPGPDHLPAPGMVPDDDDPLLVRRGGRGGRGGGAAGRGRGRGGGAPFGPPGAGDGNYYI